MSGWIHGAAVVAVIAFIVLAIRAFWPERPKTAEQQVDDIMQSLNHGRETRPGATTSSFTLDSKPRPGDPRCEWKVVDDVLHAEVTVPNDEALKMLLGRLTVADGWWVTQNANSLDIRAKCVPASQ